MQNRKTIVASVNNSNTNHTNDSRNESNLIFNYAEKSTENLVEIKKDQLITTSYKLSIQFRKRHKAVLRDIDNLIEQLPKDLQEHNFVPLLKIRQLPNGGYKEERYFEITRDGFTLLAFGFTGKNALEFKLKYIKAFNLMEAKLKELFLNQVLSLDKHHILEALAYLVMNGRKLYNYRELQRLLNFSTKSSISNVRRKYADQLYMQGRTAWVSEEYALLMISRAETRDAAVRTLTVPAVVTNQLKMF